MPDATQGLTLVTTMTTSIAGDAYIGGIIYGQVTFGTTQLNCQNAYGDGFIAKIDPIGNWVWATNFNSPYDASGTTSNTTVVTGLAESLGGGLIVSGTQKGFTDFLPCI